MLTAQCSEGFQLTANRYWFDEGGSRHKNAKVFFFLI